MALAGPLHQISVEEALRLIDTERRAGLLIVRHGGLSAGIYLEASQILCAQRSGPGQTLGERLVSARLVTPQQLGQVRSQYRDQPIEKEVDLARTLLQSKYLAGDALRSWVMADAVELLVVLLSWSDGMLSFEESVAPPQGRMVIPVPISAVLDEALRHIARRRQRASSARVTVTLELVLDFAEDVDPAVDDIQITPEQWSFLTAIDGQKSLRELVQGLGLPPAVAQRLASELLSTGILTVSGLHPDSGKLMVPLEPNGRQPQPPGATSRPRQSVMPGGSGGVPAVNGRLQRGPSGPIR